VVPVTPGTNVQQSIQAFKLDVSVGDLEVSIARLKDEFELVTGVNAIEKGAGGGESTLGQTQIKEAKSIGALFDILLGNVNELNRLAKDMIQDILFFMPAGEFVQYAARVSGLSAEKITKALPSMQGIEQEFTIHNPVTAGGEDRQVLATQLMRIFQMAGESLFTNPAVYKYFMKVIEIAGLPRPSELGIAPEEPLSPTDEHMMLGQGQWVVPSMAEDAVSHLNQHKRYLELAQQNVVQGLSEESRLLTGQLLPLHIEDTQELIQLQAQQQAQQSGRGQLEGVGAGGGGGLNNPLGEPTRGEEIQGTPAGGLALGNRNRQTANAVQGSNLQ
jgi:hypothetical protein